jgi:formylglycine-generating enzyme required for sulfatase activity
MLMRAIGGHNAVGGQHPEISGGLLQFMFYSSDRGDPVEYSEPETVLLEGGSFVMGSASGREDEDPPHVVELSPFYIARFAVRNREYGIYLRQTGAQPSSFWSDPKFNHPDQPVVAVSWFDAAAYCAWLGHGADEELI